MKTLYKETRQWYLQTQWVVPDWNRQRCPIQQQTI